MISTVYLTRNSIAAIILLLASVMIQTLASAAQDDTAVETSPLENHSLENDGNVANVANVANEEITPDIATTDSVSDKSAIENEPVKGSDLPHQFRTLC